VSPEIIRAKLSMLQQVLLDLKPHVAAPRPDQERAHYEVERQVQLAVDLSIALGRRILVLRGVPVPETSRQVFLALGDLKVIGPSLAKDLAGAVGLRNLLVHEYGDLDYGLFFGGLKKGHAALVSFSGSVQKLLQGHPGRSGSVPSPPPPSP
jgi:uncharacterized protein YutE (UPF0331/DUF86 family)